MGSGRRGHQFTPGQYPVADFLLGMVSPENEVPIGPALKGMQAIINPGLLSAGGARMLKALQSLKGARWKDLLGKLESKSVPADRAASAINDLGRSFQGSRMGPREASPFTQGRRIEVPRGSFSGDMRTLQQKELKTLGNAIEKQPLDDVSMSYVKGGEPLTSGPLSQAERDYLQTLRELNNEGTISKTERLDLDELLARADAEGAQGLNPTNGDAIRAAEKQERYLSTPTQRKLGDKYEFLTAAPESGPRFRHPVSAMLEEELTAEALKRRAAGEMTLQPIEGGARLDPADIRQAAPDPGVESILAEQAAKEAAAKQKWAQEPTSIRAPRIGRISAERGGGGPPINPDWELAKAEGLLSRMQTDAPNISAVTGWTSGRIEQGAKEALLERTIEALRRRASKEPLTLTPLSKLPE